jgi:hypothetical protein
MEKMEIRGISHVGAITPMKAREATAMLNISAGPVIRFSLSVAKMYGERTIMERAQAY